MFFIVPFLNVHIRCLFFDFPSCSGQHRALSRAPRATRRGLAGHVFYLAVSGSRRGVLSLREPRAAARQAAVRGSLQAGTLEWVGVSRQGHWSGFPFGLLSPTLCQCCISLAIHRTLGGKFRTLRPIQSSSPVAATPRPPVGPCSFSDTQPFTPSNALLPHCRGLLPPRRWYPLISSLHP